MKPSRLTDNNVIFGVDQAGVIPVHATRWRHEGKPIVSIGFLPDSEELALLRRGLPVIVHLVGLTMPPMWVTVGTPHTLEDEEKD